MEPISAQLSDKTSILNEHTHACKHKCANSNQLLVVRDNFCWICHQIITVSANKLECNACVRAYHRNCLPNSFAANEQTCPQCVAIISAEQSHALYGIMRFLNGQLDQLVHLFVYAIERIKAVDRHKLFHAPVDIERYHDYCDRVVNPMDLSIIEANVRKRVYASTISFLADIKWIHHNCVVYNPSVSDYAIASQKLLSKAMEECDDIETCADCFKHYCEISSNKSYFREPCRKPHGIVWAKVSGYPYWPAKAVKYDDNRHNVMVIFFGTRDKCWLSVRRCYLISKTCPTLKNSLEVKDNSLGLNEAIKDLNMHIINLDQRFPRLFRYWPMKTAFTREHLYLTNNETFARRSHGVALKNLRVRAQPFALSADLLP